VTITQATAALKLWGEIQRAQRAGDAEQRGHRSKASFRATPGAGQSFKSEAPARPITEEVQRQAAAVESALRELAPTMRLILRLKYRNGLKDELIRMDVRLMQMSKEDYQLMKRHAVELLALRMSGNRSKAGPREE
jgi:hypothetical protein